MATNLMNLKDGDQRCVEVIGLRLLGVIDLNRVLSTLQVEHRRLIEILREQVHVHGGGHHNDLGIKDSMPQLHDAIIYTLIMTSGEMT